MYTIFKKNWTLIFFLMMFWAIHTCHIALSGDENYYFNVGSKLWNFLAEIFKLNFEKANQIFLKEVIDKGWFYPATSIIIAPVFLFTKSLILVRFWVFLINGILLFYAVNEVRKLFNKQFATYFLFGILIFPAIMYTNVLLWGEGMSSKLLIILLLILFKTIINQRLSSKTIVIISLLAVCIFCLRKSYVLILPFTGIYVVVYSFIFAENNKTIFRNIKISTLTFIFSLIITQGPWIYGLNKKFNGPVLFSTTSITHKIPFRLENKLDDKMPEKLRKTNRHHKLLYYFDSISKKNSTSLKREVDNFLATVSLDEYNKFKYAQSKMAFTNFYKNVNQFPVRFQNDLLNTKNALVNKNVISVINTLNLFMYVVFLTGSLFFLFFTPFVILYKKLNPLFFFILGSIFIVLTIQPFLVICNPRHAMGLPILLLFITLYCVLLKDKFRMNSMNLESNIFIKTIRIGNLSFSIYVLLILYNLIEL